MIGNIRSYLLLIINEGRACPAPFVILFLILFLCSQVVGSPVLEDDITGVRSALLDKDRVRALVLGGCPRYLRSDALEVLDGVELLQTGLGAQLGPGLLEGFDERFGPQNARQVEGAVPFLGRILLCCLAVFDNARVIR